MDRPGTSNGPTERSTAGSNTFADVQDRIEEALSDAAFVLFVESFGHDRKVVLPLVTVYQSRLYTDRIPASTWRIAETEVGDIKLVEAVAGEEPRPGANGESLAALRDAMLRPVGPGRTETLSAGLFIGGMEGVRKEFDLFRERFPSVPVYAFAGPGGIAARLARGLVLVKDSPHDLVDSPDYAATMDSIVADVAVRGPEPPWQTANGCP